jgi:hypothetical protein
MTDTSSQKWIEGALNHMFHTDSPEGSDPVILHGEAAAGYRMVKSICKKRNKLIADVCNEDIWEVLAERNDMENKLDAALKEKDAALKENEKLTRKLRELASMGARGSPEPTHVLDAWRVQQWLDSQPALQHLTVAILAGIGIQYGGAHRLAAVMADIGGWKATNNIKANGRRGRGYIKL